MNTRWLAWLPALVLWAVTYAGLAQQPGRIRTFSPQGTVKIRQVRAQFSNSWFPSETSRRVESFEIVCSERGTGRWADSGIGLRLERDLPAGVRCEFTVKAASKHFAR
jgi:hypothetical protein